MIGYHWSPTTNRDSIRKHGLLVPFKHPRLTIPVTCSDGHRNPHISLARNPIDAWELSGGFLKSNDKWDLWLIVLDKVKYTTIPHWDELEVSQDIPRRYVIYTASRGGSDGF